ncbi:MAG: hypothetical protein ACFB0C_19550 [Leptolyngbyaceae cyanobacterium]
MALSVEQIKGASAALESRLQKVCKQGARLTLSPVLQGPLSKGEVQVFHEKDSYAPSAISDFNSGSRRDRTITWRINILLKNLNATEPAVPLMEYIKGQLEGWQPFGSQPWLVDDGIATVSDSGFRKLNDDNFWWYSIALEATISELIGGSNE